MEMLTLMLIVKELVSGPVSALWKFIRVRFRDSSMWFLLSTRLGLKDEILRHCRKNTPLPLNSWFAHALYTEWRSPWWWLNSRRAWGQHPYAEVYWDTVVRRKYKAGRAAI